MENIFYEGQVIWAMADTNGHLRHSAYADFAAQARVSALESENLMAQMMSLQIGPILFREELVYMREIRMNEFVKVSVELLKAREDYARYTIKSCIYRVSDGEKCAEITVDGAFMDLQKRKLAVLPENLINIFKQMPKSSHFVLEAMKNK